MRVTANIVAGQYCTNTIRLPNAKNTLRQCVGCFLFTKPNQKLQDVQKNTLLFRPIYLSFQVVYFVCCEMSHVMNRTT